ncbi:MAG TPA: hypothetical protein VIO61_04315 [Anaerolineaceae bacterium]
MEYQPGSNIDERFPNTTAPSTMTSVIYPWNRQEYAWHKRYYR